MDMRHVWEDVGPLALICSELGVTYVPRPAQISYASTVAIALERDRRSTGGILLIEGGTGIGKTLGYLIPVCLEISQFGGRALIATHTLALMRQVVDREAPIAISMAQRVLGGKSLRVSELRGRRNFASPERCRAAAAALLDMGTSFGVAPLLALADKAEMAAKGAATLLAAGLGSDKNGVAWSLVHAAMIDSFVAEAGIDLPVEDIHLHTLSPDEEQAPYYLGRQLAQDADILVTTHAMAAVSLTLRTLPGIIDKTNSYRALIIDEADRWSTAAASVAAASLSLDTVVKAIQKLNIAAHGTSVAKRLSSSGSEAISIIDELRVLAPTGRNTILGIKRGDRVVGLVKLLGGLINQIVDTASFERDKTASAAGTVLALAQDVGRIERAIGCDDQYWFTEWHTSRVHGQPSIVVRSKAPGRLASRIWAPRQDVAPLAKSVIMTSATLATPGLRDEARWNSISVATGVPIGTTSFVHSDIAQSIQPENYGRMRVRFADPTAPVPSPGIDGVLPWGAITYIGETIAAAHASGGRTLVLVPAYEDVLQIQQVVPSTCVLHRQGVSLREMLVAYCADPSACLITPAAWLGVDLPGMVDQLVIPRLPFPPREHDCGKTTFEVGIISDMLNRLSQGLGRGIRSQTDNVTVWFADPRMPPPLALVVRTMKMPHPKSSSQYLAAIPERFRCDFNKDDEAAQFGVSIMTTVGAPTVRMRAKGGGRPPNRKGKNRQGGNPARPK